MASIVRVPPHKKQKTSTDKTKTQTDKPERIAELEHEFTQLSQNMHQFIHKLEKEIKVKGSMSLQKTNDSPVLEKAICNFQVAAAAFRQVLDIEQQARSTISSVPRVVLYFSLLPNHLV